MLATTCAFAIGGAALAAGITVHDARNRDVTIADPARIVSIGGAITEILYALGFEDRLAGVDATSLYPTVALRDKPNVGYMRQLSAEGVLGLNPSLVLAVQGSGPKETMDVLEAAKVPLVLVPETFSEQGLLDKIKLVGRAMGADARAECLTAAVSSDLAQLRELRAKVTKPVRVMFVMSLLNGRAMVAGQRPRRTKSSHWPAASTRSTAMTATRSSTTRRSSRQGPTSCSRSSAARIRWKRTRSMSHPAFALTPVAANKAFISMEGLYLLGFGPRTAAAARDLSVKLYPALAPQAEQFTPAALTANCRQ